MKRRASFIGLGKLDYRTVVACLFLASGSLLAQSSSPHGDVGKTNVLDQRIEKLSALLDATQAQIEQEQRTLAALRAELAAIQQQRIASVPAMQQETAAGDYSSSLADKIEQQGEQQQVLQAEINQHEQTKVETESKYPLKVHGLILFNAFSNAGVVDNPDLPTVAFIRQPGTSHGSLGGSIRQTLLGIRATGPHIAGANTAAEVSADFFGGLSYNLYGSTTGNFRLRTADVSASWKRSALHLGVETPLISPLSPTSYATVAIPSLAWAGNLWTWAPQLRYEHSFGLSDTSSVLLEGGLLDTPVVGLQQQSADRILSAGELSRRPGLEGRVSYHLHLFDRELSVGAGGYQANKSYSGSINISTWAVTTDWQLPLTRRLQLDGEFYRGLGLGALGGGAYKDVIVGTDPLTGLSRTLGLNNIGGWSQLKLHLTNTMEANMSAGQDSGYASDMHRLVLTNATNPLETMARTRMLVTNIVFRPKTYLILSPEYRRIMNWQITGSPKVADIFTISAGYQF